MFILKGFKVVCFDTDLQVFILKELSRALSCGRDSLTDSAEDVAAAQTQPGCCASFTTYDNSGSTPRQLAGGTVRVQLHELLRDAEKTEMRTAREKLQNGAPPIERVRHV